MIGFFGRSIKLLAFAFSLSFTVHTAYATPSGPNCPNAEFSATACVGEKLCVRATRLYVLVITVPADKSCPEGYRQQTVIGDVDEACEAAEVILDWRYLDCLPKLECEVNGPPLDPTQTGVTASCCTMKKEQRCREIADDTSNLFTKE